MKLQIQFILGFSSYTPTVRQRFHNTSRHASTTPPLPPHTLTMRMTSSSRFLLGYAALLAVGSSLPTQCHFATALSANSMVFTAVKGSAARPLENKKVAVFGAGGYLGGCVFGFLQRAGSLYGTGISGVGGSPRAVVATSFGSLNLNSVLSKNFILAQADESFVKLTDMTSTDSVRGRVRGFHAAVLATRCSLDRRPVTLGTYEKTPNDKTFEFFMDRPRGSTMRGIDDPEYALSMFETSVRACQEEGLEHVVVVETDLEFGDSAQFVPVGDKYIKILEEAQLGFTYISPFGKLQNLPDYTYAKGLQSSLTVSRVTDPEDLLAKSSEASSIYREDLAALCVQVLLTLPWDECRVLKVGSAASLPETDAKATKPQREWCVNSDVVRSSLAGV